MFQGGNRVVCGRACGSARVTTTGTGTDREGFEGSRDGCEVGGFRGRARGNGECPCGGDSCEVRSAPGALVTWTMLICGRIGI